MNELSPFTKARIRDLTQFLNWVAEGGLSADEMIARARQLKRELQMSLESYGATQ
jgi:hypothetical protein